MAGKQGRRQFGSIRKLASGRFQARYRGPDGEEQSETFGTRSEASRFLSRVQADIDRGAWLNPALGAITFGEWATHYMNGAELRRTTRARYESALKVHLLPAFAKMPMSAITPLLVKAEVDRWKAKLAPATTWTNWRVLTAIVNAAVESDVIVKSPCRAKLMKLPSIELRERRTLSMRDLERVADNMPAAYRPLAWIGGVLGLRWSEAAALRVRSIDFLRKTITVSETVEEVRGHPVRVVAETKSEASARTIAVPTFILDMLAKHIADAGLSADDGDALLFTTTRHHRGKAGAEVGGGPLRATNFRNRVWNPAVKAAGFPDVTFHGLRHVAASLMVDNNEHPRIGQHRLGHSTSKLFMERYSHVSEEADRAAAKNLDDLYKAADDEQGDEPRAAEGPNG